MASNKLSTRRGYLLRPKVCTPSPPPSEAPGLPPRSCGLDPAEITTEPEDTEEFEFWACCEALPLEEAVACEWECTGGELTAPDSAQNCEPPDTASWEAPEETGDYTVTCLFTWSDSGQCSDSILFHVED
jgi:hypothetical protein